MSSEVSKERADEIDAMWQAASMTERLSLPRIQWFTVPPAETKFLELPPTELERFAAKRIAELQVALRPLADIDWDDDNWKDDDVLCSDQPSLTFAATKRARELLGVK